MEAERTAHLPVLVEEVRALLRPENGGLFVDGTVGLGGHARMLLERGATRLIGIDRDRDALARASEALAAFGDRVTLVHGDYREMDAVLDAQGIGMVDGILLDLGVSSMQLDAEGRGFSFRRDEPLDDGVPRILLTFLGSGDEDGQGVRRWHRRPPSTHHGTAWVASSPMPGASSHLR